MDNEITIKIVKEIVVHLVRKEYAEIVAKDAIKLIPDDEIRIAIEEYPGTVTMPPDEAFVKMDRYVINDKAIAIDMDLWYDNKKSDLTLSCRIMEKDGILEYSIENIHIL